MFLSRSSIIFFFVFLTIIPCYTYCQIALPASYGDGIPFIAADSSFSAKIGFRFQTRYEGDYNFTSEDWSDQMLVRRARLKFDGYVLNPKFVYKIELGLSNRDLRGGQTKLNGDSPNLLLDAVLKWKMRRGLTLWFGQTKLPGNRERVISSQKLQFVDRSLLNARFNLDRDIGVQLHHESTTGRAVVRKILSVSMGEGRDIIIGNHKGYDYTARVEILPFGKFTGKGDYFGSDLKREPTPKLSAGITGDFNDNSVRSRGQLGEYVTDTADVLIAQDMTTLFADAMFKYRGFSAASEYARRWIQGDDSPFTTGTGFVVQAGYLLKNNLEFAGRFAATWADRASSALADENHYTFGVSRYLSGHNLKVQTDVTWLDRESSNELQFRLQVEVAL